MTTFTFTTAVAEGVPVGAYTGVFDGIEPVPPNEERGYGAGFRFSWTITGGAHAGRRASRICGGNRPTPKNNLGRMLTALKGGALAEGEPFDPAAYVGKAYTIVVSQSAGGGTRVETVAPLG